LGPKSKMKVSPREWEWFLLEKYLTKEKKREKEEKL